MTKINKLGKSTFVIAILSFILVAVLAFGGTYAYFSATSNTAEGKVNLGHLRITRNSAKFASTTLTGNATIVVPNQKILDGASDAATGTTSSGKMSVEVDSNIAYFIRAKFTYTVELDAAAHQYINSGVADDPDTEDVDESLANKYNCKAGECTCADKEIKNVLIIDATVAGEDAPGWIASTVSGEMNMDGVQGTGWYYFNQAILHENVAAGATANKQTHTFAVTARVNPEVGQVESEHFMDAVITINVVFEVIQADYILGDGAAAADPEAYYTADVLSAAWAKADAPIVPAE